MAWHDTATDDCSVDTNKTSASSILFAKNGAATVRQWEVVETSEVRALTETAGQGKVPDTATEVKNDDATTQTTYWASIDGTTYSITVTTGTKTEYGAARRDESGQWVCTATTHKYFATGLDSKWGTTELDENGSAVTLGSGTERTTSISKSMTFQFTAENDSLYATLTTTVSEVAYIKDQTTANSIVSGHLASPTHRTIKHGNIILVARDIIIGDEKFAEAHFVSESRGWTVTKTTKSYGYEGTGWYLS